MLPIGSSPDDAVARRWARLAPIERLVERAAREVKLLASLTPIDAHVERARLTEDLGAGRRPTPRWRYARKVHGDLRHALESAERALARNASTTIERLYLARVRELALEAALCAAAGTRDISRLARERFAPREDAITREASDLCARWLREPSSPATGALVPSDGMDPRSLLSRMRAAVGRLRLPFTVVATPWLSSLAATGDRVILVATDRLVADEDAARTVLHEIEGHARPRARSLRASSALYRAGTERGVDDQEGWALLLEARAGLLGPRRRRQLAARHRAVETMLDGGSFEDVASVLVREHGLDAADAIIVAERAFRGGDGTQPGLGRERVYLESFIGVRAHLARRPLDEVVLQSGQIAVDTVDALRRFAPDA